MDSKYAPKMYSKKHVYELTEKLNNTKILNKFIDDGKMLEQFEEYINSFKDKFTFPIQLDTLFELIISTKDSDKRFVVDTGLIKLDFFTFNAKYICCRIHQRTSFFKITESYFEYLRHENIPDNSTDWLPCIYKFFDSIINIYVDEIVNIDYYTEEKKAVKYSNELFKLQRLTT
jgi:hypothetical protein